MNRGYWQSLPERFGFLPHSFSQTGPGAIWLHAVSVGEVIACVGFVRRLKEEFPRTRIFVSTSTLAGRATADEKLAGLATGVFYAPVDYVFAVRRVLRALKPSVVVIAETEVWPNLFREVRRTGAGLTIVNGRISDRAFSRYLLFKWLFREVLPNANSILAQTDDIRERFLAIGALPDAVRVNGNFKYDFDAVPAGPGSPVVELLDRVRAGKVWIAASTMPPAAAGDVDEDDAVLEAFRELAPRNRDMALILAPRKPERFDTVAKKLEAAGIPFVRRSELPAAGQAISLPFVLLLDTIGELSGLFALADAVFMGGTLAGRGGHNILEPALFARPVIVGPHMENFQTIADEFRASDACVDLENAGQLAAAVSRLLGAPERGKEIGQHALACASARRGATARAVEEVRTLYRGHVPRVRPALPRLAVCRPLAEVWKWGGGRKRARALARQRKLEVPVISVGNLTMGGTGKTPCVLRLAEALKERGHRPGILTRGYKRSTPESHLVVGPGADVRPEQSGDEPQLFIRSGLAPVGIGADRFKTGLDLCRQFDVDVILLDDGFQHARLARDLDIVLMDALDPFGGDEVFPLGRLREPAAALDRADVVLITRSDLSDTPMAMEARVGECNPRAAVFRARSEPQAWVEARTGRAYPIGERPFERAGVFCGLGNPEGFRRTLANLGVEPADWVEFDDHHHYRPQELRRLAAQFQAAGAAALITTEKDIVNLCEGSDDLLAPLPLYWLKVKMAIDNEGDLVSEVELRIRKAGG